MNLITNLITGITGFAGSHLAELLDNVAGIKRWRSKMDNISHLDIPLYECDIRDSSSVYEVIKEVKPDRIYHLAAQSFVPTSWKAPQETLETNILGELNIFEAVRKLNLNPRIQIACSSEEYGLVKDLPTTEDSPLRPLSPYGVSKVGQDMLAYQYYKSYGLDIVRTRAFNHTGARRGEPFVCSSFAKQIAEIERGKRDLIKVGNLKAKRDFTDVRDIVKGYKLALDKGEAGEVYNICSEIGVSIQRILDMLIDLAHCNIIVKQDPKRMRPSDVPILLGDCSKFKKLGWEREYGLKDTLKWLLDYWRERV